jgi:hypothetical protein
VRTLLQKLLDEMPSAQHRLALDACATIPAMTEPALAAALACDDAHAIFEWVAGLSFIEYGPRGLFPHDLAREVLYADSRWRDPELRRTLNARLLWHLYERFQRAQGVEQQRIWFDLIYVQRYNPGLRPFYAWSEVNTLHAHPIEPSDEAAILQMTARHQSAASATIAAHWLRRQPTAFLGFRDAMGDLVGYMANLRLDAVTPEDCAVDPALNPALEFMRARGPRAGEHASYQRFWMGRDDHQSGRATMNVVAANASAYWTSHPTMAWNFVAVADPEHFAPMFNSLHIWRSPEADFEVGGHRYGVFAHDWRSEPIAQWLQAKVERASQYDSTATAVPVAPPLLVLSQDDFAEAVRQALRDYARGDALDRNPLLRTRLLQAEGAAPARADALRALLREAAGMLEGTPKDRKLRDAILHTYLQPSATQEQAAELLGVPFNTYRYRLARGTERITEWLWRHEIAGA